MEEETVETYKHPKYTLTLTNFESVMFILLHFKKAVSAVITIA